MQITDQAMDATMSSMRLRIGGMDAHILFLSVPAARVYMSSLASILQLSSEQ
ncbi:MAG TPA: hypothetical protein ACQGQJ_02690 [Xylella fastidiosa subsp. multiplex]